MEWEDCMRIDSRDLVRLAAYSQTEGGFRTYADGPRFTFFLHQISDMRELLSRALIVKHEKFVNKNTYVQFYSGILFDLMQDLGFYKFSSRDWNIPRCIYASRFLKQEYLRAIIDSLGEVDIDRTSPYVRVVSHNNDSLVKLSEIYGGKFYALRRDGVLQWKGKEALDLLGYLDWEFYCFRNIRGAEIVKNVSWDRVL
jgi:hypothetical protein